MKNITKSFYVLFFTTLPLVASAAESVPVTLAINAVYIKGYADLIINVINKYLAPGLLALAFIVFLWGVYKQFIWKGDSGEAHTEGAKFVATGLIGFVIILSLWALVNIAQVTLGVKDTATRPETPKF